MRLSTTVAPAALSTTKRRGSPRPASRTSTAGCLPCIHIGTTCWGCAAVAAGRAGKSIREIMSCDPDPSRTGPVTGRRHAPARGGIGCRRGRQRRMAAVHADLPWVMLGGMEDSMVRNRPGRLPRRLAWAAVALLALYALYLVAGNAFLHSRAARDLVNRKPEKFRMEWAGGHTL